MTHKHEDLKLTAVRYYLDNDTTYAETCRISIALKEVWKGGLIGFKMKMK